MMQAPSFTIAVYVLRLTLSSKSAENPKSTKMEALKDYAVKNI